MYNLNINMAGIDGPCNTPKTPEVLNSVIAMSSGPFTYPSGSGPHQQQHSLAHQVSPLAGGQQAMAQSSNLMHPSQEIMPPPSVQHTCSQLIKEGLKLTIQSKRKTSGGPEPVFPNNDTSPAEDVNSMVPKMQYFSSNISSSGDDELTAEDAERRRRRRERNKIAATKCRLKKREKTVNLVQESEVLDAQNHDLKAQIKNLEAEQRRLVDMLTVHQPACINNITSNPVSLIGVKDPQMAPHNQHHYSNYYSGHGSCNSPQESPQNPYVHVEVYPHHQGLDRGCLV
ncbi:activating transcription factor 3 isoform X2 [Neocloeon triangulifer]|uniref:activating transcription factor 3 isoform X2 n=1 Tax=Neocloeon triangulifer TaxID=2078957 RepID=UPI00286F3281|nr:activating transcription factor 3 isoform X2 [Neocloeon triangulifer]